MAKLSQSINLLSISLLVSGERLPWREIDTGRINVDDDDGDNLATLLLECEEIFSSKRMTSEQFLRG